MILFNVPVAKAAPKLVNGTVNPSAIRMAVPLVTTPLAGKRKPFFKKGSYKQAGGERPEPPVVDPIHRVTATKVPSETVTLSSGGIGWFASAFSSMIIDSTS